MQNQNYSYIFKIIDYILVPIIVSLCLKILNCDRFKFTFRGELPAIITVMAVGFTPLKRTNSTLIQFFKTQ